MLKNYRVSLGSEFKGYNRAKLIKDVMAGVTVAAVALPLALAFGVSSGATASAGLVTAIVAGLVIGTLSGGFYQISGPTGAMAAILIALVSQYKMQGVFVATFMAGIFLLLAGLFRLGRLTALIPSSVITGFTSGIAVIIASGQIKNLVGLSSFNGSFLALMHQILTGVINPTALMIGILTILLMIFYPKSWNNQLPASLIAIVFATLFVLVFKIDVPVVGKMPTTLLPDNRFHLDMLNLKMMQGLLVPAFSIAALGMIESLLCGASAGRAAKQPLDNNQELVAQGVGNMVLPFFGGIPATAAIARTSVAIKSGAQTRLAGIVHALILLLSMFLFAPLMSAIPLSALAGVLIMTAIRMNEWEAIDFLVKHQMKGGMIKFLVTMVVTVAFDLSTAILVGIVIGFVLFILKVSQIEISTSQIDPKRMNQHPNRAIEDWYVIYVTGPLFFLTSDQLKTVVEQLPDESDLIFSLRGVSMVDVTTLKLFIDILTAYHAQGRRIVFSSMSDRLYTSFQRAGIVAQAGESAFYPAVNQFLVALWEEQDDETGKEPLKETNAVIQERQKN
ncbi:MAG: SulP family inorganic anion transporter [Streptococcaceae bacterium]|jgi:SulP family sulfate permease|nr:SulP family inorganic anion transporter [Streptococcaceae bacterium]